MLRHVTTGDHGTNWSDSNEYLNSKAGRAEFADQEE